MKVWGRTLRFDLGTPLIPPGPKNPPTHSRGDGSGCWRIGVLDTTPSTRRFLRMDASTTTNTANVSLAVRDLGCYQANKAFGNDPDQTR